MPAKTANDAVDFLRKRRKCEFGFEDGAATAIRTSIVHPLTSDEIKRLAEIPTLKEVYIANQEFFDDDLAVLAKLPRLSALWLESPNLRGPGLLHLKACRELKRLFLREVNPEMLAAASQLKSLEWIDLVRGKIKDESLRPLASLPRLTKLSLDGRLCSGAGLAAFHSHSKLTTIEISGAKKLPEEVFRIIAAVPCLESLELSSSKLSTEGLQAIAAAPRLKSLDLSHSEGLSEEGLQAIASIPHLETLHLHGRKVFKNAWLAALRDCPALRVLTLSGNRQLRDVVFGRLGALPELRELDMNDTPITGTKLKALAGALHLCKLNLSQTKLEDQGAAHLELLTGLTWLSLGETKITDKTLDRLASLPALESLDVHRCHGMTESGVRSLSRLKGLKELAVWGMNLSPEVLASLIAELPRLEKLVLYEFSNPQLVKSLQRPGLKIE
jgi:Leucine-rich repeat (LRR) protein